MIPGTWCPQCRQPVLWAVTVNGKRIALNPDPDADGNQAAYREGTPAGAWHTRQLKKGEEPLAYERRYMPHVATCAKHHRPAQPPIGRTPPGGAQAT